MLPIFKLLVFILFSLLGSTAVSPASITAHPTTYFSYFSYLLYLVLGPFHSKDLRNATTQRNSSEVCFASRQGERPLSERCVGQRKSLRTQFREKKRATQQKTPQRKSFVNRVALDTEADTEPASREKTSASFEGGRTRGPAGGGTLKEASWRARARQVPFLRPLWEGSPSQTRPTRAAHMRAWVARSTSEPTANIEYRA